MSLMIDVDVVVIEDLLESLLPCGPGRRAARGVPRAVKADDDPRRLGAVDVGEVVLEPVDLLVRGAEGTVDVLNAVENASGSAPADKNEETQSRKGGSCTHGPLSPSPRSVSQVSET